MLWEQSAELNARVFDHAMCPGALVRHVKGSAMSCQYSLVLLRWIRRRPEDFLTGPVVDVGDLPLADGLACTPSRLTNLRTASLADMDLTMRITQWLAMPAARFVHAAHH